MKVVSMPIIGPEKCRGMYKVSINLTESNEFCAGYFKKNIGICSVSAFEIHHTLLIVKRD